MMPKGIRIMSSLVSPRVKRGDLYREHGYDVTADGVSGSAELNITFQCAVNGKCRYKRSVHQRVGQRADKSRHPGGKHDEFALAEGVRDANADAHAHQRFRDVRDRRDEAAEGVLPDPSADLRQDGARDQRTEKPLRHPGKRRDEIPLGQRFQILHNGLFRPLFPRGNAFFRRFLRGNELFFFHIFSPQNFISTSRLSTMSQEVR